MILRLFFPFLFTLVFTTTTFTTTANAGWILDANSAIEFRDNLNNAEQSTDKRSDTAAVLSLRLGKYYQVADYTGIALSMDVESVSHKRFSKLDKVTPKINLNLVHKFGLGPSAIKLNVFGSYGQADYRDKFRDSIVSEFGINASKWINERLRLSLGYRFHNRNGNEESYTTTSTTTTNSFYVFNNIVVPTSTTTTTTTTNYTDLFDIQANTFSIQGAWLLTPEDTLQFGYRFRTGDIVSVATPTTSIYNASSAVSPDSVFKGLYAYRINGITQSFSLGLSHAMDRQWSINFDYSFHNSNAQGGNSYNNNNFQIGVAYSY